MNETGPEISPLEQELVKKTTDSLHFRDRRKTEPKSPDDKSTEVKQLLEHYTSSFADSSVDKSKGIYLLDPDRSQSMEEDSQEPGKPSWESLGLENMEIDYEPFIAELIHQQEKILREQGHNFGDEKLAKELLFPTVLRFTNESLAKQKEIQELIKAYYNDAKTGTLSSKFYDDRLESTIESELESGKEIALLFLDTDNFKGMNDALSHEYGDEVLKIVGDILNNEVRDLDLVIRKGGDEFAILLKNVSPEKAQEVAERIRAAAEMAQLPNVPEGKIKPKLSFSIGVSSTGTATTFEELAKQAEVSMYHSKRTPDGQDRKNAVTQYVPGMTMPKGGENGRNAEQTTEN